MPLLPLLFCDEKFEEELLEELVEALGVVESDEDLATPVPQADIVEARVEMLPGAEAAWASAFSLSLDALGRRPRAWEIVNAKARTHFGGAVPGAVIRWSDASRPAMPVSLVEQSGVAREVDWSRSSVPPWELVIRYQWSLPRGAAAFSAVAAIPCARI